MHAHTHLHTMHTERKRRRESYSSGRSPWEVNPVREVHCKILIFHFTGTNPKAQPKKNSAAEPNNNGVQPHSSDTAGVGIPPPFVVHTSVPPLTRQVVPEGKQSSSPCVKGALPALLFLQRSGFVATLLSHPHFLCTVGGCCTPNFTVFCLLHPRPRGFWTICIIKHESAISVSPEALLVYWPSAICSYTLAK